MSMKVLLSPILLLVALLATAAPGLAQVAPPACQFRLGFGTLHDSLPAVVGDCLEDEAYAANGDSLQHTTHGLLAWRKADNLAAFTDGSSTWVLGPNGIQQRPNSQRFPFEHDQLNLADLKLRLLDAFGPLLYCDPDFFPIARLGGEQERALARFPEIQADAATLQAIAAHEGLDPARLSDAQKLAVYRLWKQLNALQLQPRADGAFDFAALFGPDSRSGVRVQGTIDASGTIQVTVKQPAPFLACPICLVRGTLVATPAGDMRVEDIRPGMVVWTEDGSGLRQAVPVLQVGNMPAPAGHQVVRLALDDGRDLQASPGHPAADGRPLGQLRPGDRLDGARVLSATLESYEGSTFDLLPAGPTGFYWANGVLLGSTLRR